ncbi:hypothetical protein RI367_007684 [Sorochytrium milnesiophthora]
MAPYTRVVQALYDYPPQNDDELALVENQLVYVLDESDPEWLQCSAKAAAPGEEDRVGYVPANYVDEPLALYAAVALYDYEPANDDEVALRENTPLDVIEETDADWLLVRVAGDAHALYGLVPRSYIEQTPQEPSNGRRVSSSTTASAARPASVVSVPAPALPPAAAPIAPPPVVQSIAAPRAAALPTGPPKIATALYTFEPQEDGDLDIREGENCIVLDDSDPDWYQVKVVSSKKDRNGRTGMVPRDYVQLKEVGKVPAAAAAGPAAPPLPAPPVMQQRRPSDLEREEQAKAQELERKQEQERQQAEQRRKQEQERQRALEEQKERERQQEAQQREELAERLRKQKEAAAVPPPSLPNRPVVSATKAPAVAAAASATAPAAKPPTTSAAPKAVVREWSDKSGKFKVEAELVDFIEGKTVRILKTNGVTIDVPVESLAFRDVEYLYKLRNIPIPEHLREAAKPPPASAPAAKSAPPADKPPSAPRATAASQPQYTHNGFNWFTYLTNLGIAQDDAAVYAAKFAKEKLDSTILPDLTRDVLKKEFGLAEGDIIRIQRSIANSAAAVGGSQNEETTKRKIAEHEAKLAQQNLAKIDEFFAAKVQQTEAEQSEMAKRAQLAQDEQLARHLQQQEMLAAQGQAPNQPLMPTQSNLSPAQRRKATPANTASSPSLGEIQQRLKAANLTESKPSVAAPALTTRKSTPLPVTATSASSSTSFSNTLKPGPTPSFAQSSPMLAATSAMQMNGRATPTASLSGSASPSLPMTAPIAQPNRALPPPLIPTPNLQGPAMNATGAPMFVPTVHTGMPSAQQQQFQQPMQQQFQQPMQQMIPNQMSGGAALRMGVVNAQPTGVMGVNGAGMGMGMGMGMAMGMQQPVMGMATGVNPVMGGVMPGAAPMAPVNVSATGRAANWQNATPDNPFGNAAAVNNNSANGAGISRSQTQGFLQQYQQPTGMGSFHSVDNIAAMAGNVDRYAALKNAGGPSAGFAAGGGVGYMPTQQTGLMNPAVMHMGMMQGQQLPLQQQQMQQQQQQQQQQMQGMNYNMGQGLMEQQAAPRPSSPPSSAACAVAKKSPHKSTNSATAATSPTAVTSVAQEPSETLDTAAAQEPLVSFPAHMLCEQFRGQRTVPCGFEEEEEEERDADVQFLKRYWVFYERGSMNPSHFSVMSWNILAPAFAERSAAVEHSVASGCTRWELRRQSILNELLFYEPDVVCLQEVDAASFEFFFQPALDSVGYDGVYTAKSPYDGCATLFRRDRFVVRQTRTLQYNQIELGGGASPVSVHTRHTPFPQIAQIVVLQNKHTRKWLRVVNTHLLWQPEFADSKLLQTAILMEALQQHQNEWNRVRAKSRDVRGSAAVHPHRGNTAASTATANAGAADDSGSGLGWRKQECMVTKNWSRSTVSAGGGGARQNRGGGDAGDQVNFPTVLCCDLNSVPDSPVLEFLTTGQTSTMAFDGNNYGRFSKRKSVTHKLPLQSAYKDTLLPYTHCAQHFRGTIDYVLHSSNIKLVGRLDTDTIHELLRTQFTDSTTKVNKDALQLATEYLRLFTLEALFRSAEVQAGRRSGRRGGLGTDDTEDGRQVTIDDLEKPAFSVATVSEIKRKGDMGNLCSRVRRRGGQLKPAADADPEHCRVASSAVVTTAAATVPVIAKPDPKQFLWSKHTDTQLVKTPGELNGNSFAIEECENCDMVVLDHTSQVTIDVVNGSRVFIGPVDGSLFIRDCRNCTFTVLCRQFRMRDCENCTVFLYAATQPIIESSRNLRFGPWGWCTYRAVGEQCTAAKLNVAANAWDKVHDFGPLPAADAPPNFCIMGEQEVRQVQADTSVRINVPQDVVDRTGWTFI